MKRSGFQTMSPYVYPFYIMTHPKDGFQEMKMNKKSSLSVTVLIVLAYVLVDMLYRKYVDYDVNGYDPDQISAARVMFLNTVTFFIVTASNWCFCTLLDGKGKYRDIFYVAACSVLPMLIMNTITIILSYFFSMNVSIILQYPGILAKVWSLLLFAVGLSEIHDYSMRKTLLSLVLTVVGILVILFLAMLVVSMFQNLYFFLVTVGFELKYM